jgi:hypothetical protein
VSGPAFAVAKAGVVREPYRPHECRRARQLAEIEIGIFKSGRQAYGFDDIAIVPSRRTRDPEDVEISWEIDAYRFELPLLGAAMDGVISPFTAIELGKLGGLGVLNLEGLWTRYEDPTNLFDEIRELDDDKATARMQQMYSEPIIPELVTARIRQMKEAGITTAASKPVWKRSSTFWSFRAPLSRPSTCPRPPSPSTSSASSASSTSPSLWAAAPPTRPGST